MKNILKLGFLDLPENRWIDALMVFDNVFNIVLFSNEKNRLNNSRIISYSITDNEAPVLKRKVNSLLLILLLNRKKINRYGFYLLIYLFQLINLKRIKKLAGGLEYSICHSSYNDYDNSDIITVVLKPFLKTKIVRSQKETRPEFSRKEKECFVVSDIIVFNSQYNLEFFKNKYGSKLFSNKEIILNLDEDWRKSNIWKYPEDCKKLSHKDGNKHIVILTGVARSTPNDKRTGARQFYMKIIEDLLKYGLHVHLHAMKFEPDENGVNLYKQLSEENPKFLINSSLDFVNETEDAYSQLALYDYGILHNFINGESVSYFDKFNIPHRFFEYQIAKVIPIVIKNQTIVVEQLIKEKNCGLILNNYSELENYSLVNEINFLDVSFKNYLHALYSHY